MKSELRLTKLGPKGQIIIPNELRTALKLEPGDAVILQLEGSRLVLERRRTVILSLVGKYAEPAAKPKPLLTQPISEGRDLHGA